MKELIPLTRITIATAGTRQAVSSSRLIVDSLILQADPDATGVFYVGDSTVSATKTVVVLSAGDAIEITPDLFKGSNQQLNLENIYVDCSVSGEKIYLGYIREAE